MFYVTYFQIKKNDDYERHCILHLKHFILMNYYLNDKYSELKWIIGKVSSIVTFSNIAIAINSQTI